MKKNKLKELLEKNMSLVEDIDRHDNQFNGEKIYKGMYKETYEICHTRDTDVKKLLKNKQKLINHIINSWKENNLTSIRIVNEIKRIEKEV